LVKMEGILNYNMSRFEQTWITTDYLVLY